MFKEGEMILVEAIALKENYKIPFLCKSRNRFLICFKKISSKNIEKLSELFCTNPTFLAEQLKESEFVYLSDILDNVGFISLRNKYPFIDLDNHHFFLYGYCFLDRVACA